MYHFTECDLNIKSVAQLKDAYNQIGCTEVITDKRVKANWVSALLAHQSAQIELVAVAEIKADEQVVAQKELETHITDQAETVAPEITTVEISFYDHEVYALGKQIASITHDPDDFQTQRWLVMVGETEVHRTDAWAKCHSYICWHYKQGSLPAATKSRVVGGARYHLEMEPSCAFELLDCKLDRGDAVVPDVIEIDSVIDADFGSLYRIWDSRTLLGTFYQSADNKWVAQPTHSLLRPRCNTAASASLFIVGQREEKTDLEKLLDKPFDELTVYEWEQLKQHSADLQQKLELAYTNSNFGCYNRAGAEALGNEFLQKERRRIASGELVMVCCDIAGMGKLNTQIGESRVNNAIATSLKEIRTWRGIFFISQLNSGDEFVFIVDRVDAIDIVPVAKRVLTAVQRKNSRCHRLYVGHSPCQH